MMGEVYNGVGFTGGLYTADTRWGVRYDGYVGDLTIQTQRPWQAANEERTRLFHEVIGGRVIVETALRGLEVGVSGYTGHLDDSTDVDSGERHGVVGGQVEYMHRGFDVRSEVTTQVEGGLRETAAYVESTQRLTEHWQLAARLDQSHAFGSDVAGAPYALIHHRDVAGGVNLWVAPSFVLRFEYHNIDGNRFATPLNPGQLGKRIQTVQFGSQFSF
jgi:hypothetical protein